MNARSLCLVACGGAFSATIALTGCGSGSNNDVSTETSASVSATAGNSGAQIQTGNTLNYGSFGTTTTIDCQDGKALNVGGSNNDLTVKGTCSSVNVGGSGNTIKFDKITDDLHVVGLNNTVTYRQGDPKVDNLGSGNSVKKD